ncbi:DUF2218 domain-containing protein [Nocardia africana]|uniref:Uncharacterized protein conserved in bacteria (DUF2218) n=1 Tax=Nocardia africana TaxID=134964 RepID=A0A378X3X2_9NOCA|nr:DUF2218 domain-containing protein [Nocardia africana]MCC3318389.1 DUF2218 domain-containing protein [Nocardia africana]SUA47454.1 Uncharacterized protein conserved in bacteria (DUF2218) [Nocardia africana]
MPTIRACIPTDRGPWYLQQFCTHAYAMASPRAHRMRLHRNDIADVRLSVETADNDALVQFAPWGTCTLHADAGTLTVRIDAADPPALQRIRDIVTRDLERFGRGSIRIVWTDIADTEGAPPS